MVNGYGLIGAQPTVLTSHWNLSYGAGLVAAAGVHF